MKKALLFLGVVAAAAVSGGVSAWAVAEAGRGAQVEYVEREVERTPALGAHFAAYEAGQYPDLTYAAENAVKAVVNIEAIQQVEVPRRGQFGYDPFLEFFGFPQERSRGNGEPQYREQRAGGSGVIISSDGYVVTNNHVVDGATKLRVKLNDGRAFDATLVGKDSATDVALLKIDATELPTLAFGSSDALRLGEWVLAIGSPFDLQSTITAGIVSAKARNLGAIPNDFSIESFIQTDAALNPGNSGGALVNLKGELIGINSAIYSNTGSYSGFSFAIPTTIVKKVMADIRQYGTVQRAVLGASVRELDSKIAKEKDITAVKSGLLIASVNDMSTAKELGLQEDDVITAINGVNVANHAQLVEQLNKFRPGDKVTVTYYRNNKKIEKTATLRNQTGSTSITKKGDFSELGCAFMKLTAETKTRLGISNGVQVKGLKAGAIRDAGVKEGFIITAVNDVPVNSSEDVEQVYNSVMKDSDEYKALILYGVYPTGKKYTYAVNLASE